MPGTKTSHDLAETPPQERAGSFRHASGASLAAVVLLAIALRLYRLDEQSLWFDDYTVFAFTYAPDLWSSLRHVRIVSPEHGAMPLYYMLQYGFAQWTGMNAETLRLLPVAFSVSAVPLLYGFVRYLFGRRAALLAALCLALSPQHIWHAQALKPYELLAPMVIISAWTFMRGYREDRPVWWAANLIVNTILVWTHLLMVILILTEGLFLLAFSLRRFRRVVLWSAVQLLLLVPSTVAVLCMASARSYLSGIEMSPWRVVNFILGGDIVCFHEDLLPGWKIHGPASARFPALIPPWPWFSLGLLMLFAGVSAWAAVRLISSLRQQRCPDSPPQGRCRERENMAFLLLLLLVPGLAVALIGTKSIVFASYSMYNQVALYAIVGIALTALPGVLLRRGAVLALIGLYAYQLLVFLPEVTRTDWKGAAAYIRDNASPGDEVIDIQHWLPDRELRFYLSPDWSVRLVGTFQAACDDTARFLQAVPGTAPDSAGKHVWIAVQTAYLGWVTGDRFDCMSTLEEAFQARGLKPSFKEFPGQHELILCKVERSKTDVRGIGTPVRQIRPYPEMFSGNRLLPIDYDAVLDTLGFQGCDQERRRRLLAELRESVDHWPLDERFPVNSRLCAMWPMLDLASRGHGELAEALAGYVVGEYQDCAFFHMALGAALLKEQKVLAARGAFATAGKLHRDLGIVLAPFMDALARGNDPDAVCNEAWRLDRYGFWYGPALRDVCRPDGPFAGTIPAVPPVSFDAPDNKTGSEDR